MTAQELREKYLKFFENKGHKMISSAPLVLKHDPTTLFTSSGMQPLVPYLMGKVHPEGKRLVNSQPSLRVQDIEEVGDNRHTTFFEMLGNWSLGDYFKKEQLPWIWEFLTKELDLPKEKLYISVFEGLPEGSGNKNVPKDEESYKVWKSLGIPEKKIFFYGVPKNWWSRSGTPDQMPAGEIGGPDSEVFFEFEQIKHNPKFGKECHPNCDCGKFLEIANSVFIQYKKREDGSLEELSQKNVDFGGGLERMTAAVNNNPDIFQIDLFKPFIKNVGNMYGVSYLSNEKVNRSMRIIADHLRASAMLISSNVAPSNKGQGYVLRRLIRRAVFHLSTLKNGYAGIPDICDLNSYGYPLQLKSWLEISEVIEEEAQKFLKTLNKGIKLLGKISPFDLFQTYGFPVELTEELYKEKGIPFDKVRFQKEFEKHQMLSRAKSSEMFKIGN
jgi:alanyl-tRNA synthetase